MDFMQMLNNLEDAIENAKNVPLSGKKMIDADEFFEILDAVKANVPEEIRQAQLILERESYILEDAKKNANYIIDEAQTTAREMVDEHEIVAKANAKAEEILNAARANAKEIREGSLAYARDVLRDLEGKINNTLNTVQINLREFEQ